MKRCAWIVAGFATCGFVTPCAAAENRAPSIWYRSSEGCPDGAAFLSRLRGPASGAKLAGARDRIDFVVTLGTAHGESSGRLERQTERGTVAVREITAPSCEEIADVLALTLTLALDPGESAASAPPPARSSHAGPDADAPTGAPVGTHPRHAGLEPDAGSVRQVSSPPEPRSAWSLGVQGGVLARVVPAIAPGGAAFLELEPGLRWLHHATLRLSLAGVLSERPSQPTVHMSLVAGRFEVCPVHFGSRELRAQPCLGLEAGAVRASLGETTTSDTGAWAAATGHGRVIWELGPTFALEAQAGAVGPLIRYQLRTREGDQVYRSASLGFSAAAGVAFRLP